MSKKLTFKWDYHASFKRLKVYPLNGVAWCSLTLREETWRDIAENIDQVIRFLDKAPDPWTRVQKELGTLEEKEK